MIKLIHLSLKNRKKIIRSQGKEGKLGSSRKKMISRVNEEKLQHRQQKSSLDTAAESKE